MKRDEKQRALVGLAAWPQVEKARASGTGTKRMYPADEMRDGCRCAKVGNVVGSEGGDEALEIP